MVRWRRLNFLGLAVAVTLFFSAASAGMSGGRVHESEPEREPQRGAEPSSYEARVYADGSRAAHLYFQNLSAQDVFSSRPDDIYLELQFEPGPEFSPDQLRMALNGWSYCEPSAKLAAQSRWLGEGRLGIRVGVLKFGSRRPLAHVLRDIYYYNGLVRFWVYGPRRVRSATLFFGDPNQPRPPRVVLQRVEPPHKDLSVRDVAFYFSATEGAADFECALNQGKFAPCTSPKRHTDLSNGQYAFRVRALDAEGVAGPETRYEFRVSAPEPGVALVRAVPPEPVTSETSIELHFRKVGPLAHLSRTYCRLDNGAYYWCQSPVRYKRLPVGEHRIEVWRTHWIYGYGWARELARYDWFRGLIPVHSGPLIYRWTVAKTQQPELAWVQTPPEVSGSREASFTFRSEGAERYECTLDGQSLGECEEEVRLTDLEDGSHEFTVVGYGGGVASAPLSFRWRVDVTPPELRWVSVNPPQTVVGVTELAVALSVSEPSSLSCELDGEKLEYCGTEMVLTDLSEGPHRLEVIATDSVGNVSEPLLHEWEVDLTAPEVTLQMVHPETTPTRERTARFRLLASDDAVFTCSLDGAAPFDCEPEVEVTDLSEGGHEFRVSARDAAGNTSEASFRWEVDLTPPRIELGEAVPPETVTEATGIELPFIVSENPEKVTCELDFGGQIPCASPFVANGLSEGRHRIEILAEDTAGNVAGAVYEWTIRFTAVATLTAVDPAESVTSRQDIRFEFTSSNATGFLCRLDEGAESECSSPVAYGDLGEGDHLFTVRGVNLFGEPGPEVSHRWTVDRTGPRVTIVSQDPQESPTARTDMTIAFTADEPASFYCAFGTDPLQPCTSPWSRDNLPQGTHAFRVVAEDALGNRGEEALYSWTIDVPVPVAVIRSVSPAQSPTTSRSVEFTFDAEGAESLMCRLDSAAAVPCTSPLRFDGLEDGAHTFAVWGVNAFGEAGSEATHAWEVDTTGPAVMIVSTDPATSPTARTDITIEFASSEAGARFFCALNDESLAPCASPWSRAGLGQGDHRFRVVAEDALGNRGAEAGFRWTVDVPAPVVRIDSVLPAEPVTSSTALTAHFSSEGGVSYLCALDGATPSPCASPVTVDGLGEGPHTFSVRAVNAFGEAGAPASHAWVVDLTGPVVSLVSVSPEGSPTTQGSLTATFTTDDSGARVYCRLDDGAESLCTSPHTVQVAPGAHTLTLVGVDGVGNRGEPVTYSWTVELEPLEVTGALVHTVTRNSAVVEWNTTLPASSRLVYGEGSALDQDTDTSSTLVTSHRMTLTGLKAFTLYSVQAVSVDAHGREVRSRVLTFRTQF